VLHRLAPGELDHELIWGSLGLALGAAALLLSRVPGVGLPCWFHALTGRPCMACGMTRAAIALAHADPRAAFLVNPLATVAMLAWGAWSVGALLAVALHLPRPRLVLTHPWEPNALRAITVLLVLLNWSYLIAHGT
jgi:hypothetical protein